MTSVSRILPEYGTRVAEIIETALYLPESSMMDTRTITRWALMLGAVALLAVPGVRAQEPPNPALEEFLRKQLRKVDRWGIEKLLKTERDIDLQQKHRAVTSTNPEELAVLAEDEDRGVRFHVGANAHTPLDVLLVLSQDPMPIVRSGVAISLTHDPLASPTVQSLVERIGQSLASDPTPLVRLGLAENIELPPSVFPLLARDKDFVIRQRLAENPFSTQEALDLLAQDSVMVVKVAALVHSNVPVSQLREGSKSDEPVVRQAVAQNINTPVDLLRGLAADSEPAIRLMVAAHPKAPPDIMDALSRDQDLDVLRAVASHANASREILIALAYDERDRDLRKLAQARLVPLLRTEIKEDILERWTQ